MRSCSEMIFHTLWQVNGACVRKKCPYCVQTSSRGERKDRISASNCLEHLCHSVAKMNPCSSCTKKCFLILLNICNIQTMTAYSTRRARPPAHGTLARSGFHLISLFPRGSFSRRCFPTAEYSLRGIYACVTLGSVWKYPRIKSHLLLKLHFCYACSLRRYTLMTLYKQVKMNLHSADAGK